MSPDIINSLNNVELPFVEFINSLGKGTIVDSISWLISSQIFMAFIFALFFLWVILNDKNNQKRMKVILTALIIILILHFAVTDFAIKTVLVNFTGVRERPYLAEPSLNAIGENSTDSSFPSGHVAFTSALSAVFVYFYTKRIVFVSSNSRGAQKLEQAPRVLDKRKFSYWLAGIFIFLMAFSRIHNAMHYLSDVLAGIILGIAYCFIAIYFSRILWERRKKK